VRRVVYSVASSLDGFIAGPRGEFDWIPADPDVVFAALFARFDAVLMGRRSYEAARAQGEGGMPGLPTWVVSTTLRPEDCPGATVSRDPGAAVRALRARPGRDLWLFGGGSLFRSLLELGLVDEVQVAVVPVLLGGGRALLEPPAPRSRLRLARHRVYPRTGTVLLEYEVDPNRGSVETPGGQAR
jgi:dihydrofolate reductase